MEQSTSWEANSYLVTQESSRLLWNPKVHIMFTRAHRCSLPFSQMHPVHTFPPHFPKIHSNIFPSVPSSSMWSLPFRFSNKNFIRIFCFFHSCCMHFPFHHLWLVHPKYVVKHMSYKAPHCAFSSKKRNSLKYTWSVAVW